MQIETTENLGLMFCSPWQNRSMHSETRLPWTIMASLLFLFPFCFLREIPEECDMMAAIIGRCIDYLFCGGF